MTAFTILLLFFDDPFLPTDTTGVTYIRWGKPTCPQTPGTEMLYAGRAGGTFYNIRGGGAEILCLPETPEYLNGTSRIGTTLGGIPRMFGTEYEFFGTSPLANLANHNVPCASCYVPTRGTVNMIPAKINCPTGWTREYYGYLTTEHEGHYRSSYNCVDINSENMGSTGNENGAVIYYVASTCHGFDCPPYENDRALSCVVCTK